DRDDRADAFCRADGELAAMQLQQRARYCQAKARACMVLRELILHLLEGLAEPPQRLAGNAAARILDGDHRSIRLLAGADPDLAVLIGELVGIGEEVDQYLLDRPAFGDDRHAFGDILRNLDLLLLRLQ